MKGLAHSWLPVLSRTASVGPNIWTTYTLRLADLAWQPTTLPSLTTVGGGRCERARACVNMGELCTRCAVASRRP